MSTTIRTRYTRSVNVLKTQLADLSSKAALLKQAAGSETDPTKLAEAISTIRGFEKGLAAELDNINVQELAWLKLIGSMGDDAAEREDGVMATYTQTAEGPDAVTSKTREILKELASLKDTISKKMGGSLSSQSPALPGPSSSQHSGAPLRLPKMELPKFTGNPMEWNQFMQLFRSSVDSNSSLSTVAKFHYLISSLEGPARNCVAGFEIKEENYAAAIERLTDRFGNEKKISRDLHSQLAQLKCKGSSLIDLYNYVDRLECILLQMENLNIDITGESTLIQVEKSLPGWLDAQIFQARLADQNFDIQSLRKLLKRISETATERTTKSFIPSSAENVTTLPATVHPNKATDDRRKKKKKPKDSVQPARKDPRPCPFCQGTSHGPRGCDRYSTASARRTRAKELNLCFNCLSDKHVLRSCTSKGTCRNCRSRHHTSICEKTTTTAAAADTERITSATADLSSAAAHSSDGRETALMTREVTLCNPVTKKAVRALALFDSGCQATMITQNLAAALDLTPLSPRKIRIQGFSGSHSDVDVNEHTVGIATLDGSYRRLDVWSVPTLLKSMQVIRIPTGTETPLEVIRENRSPSVIIGNDYFWSFIKRQTNKHVNGFNIIESTVGPLLHGTAPRSLAATAAPMVTALPCVATDKENDNAISKWLALEGIGITEDANADDHEAAWNLFKKTCRFVDGRYSVSLPLRDPDAVIPTNEGVAIRQLINMKQNLDKKPHVKQEIQKIIDDWLSEGVVEIVPKQEVDNPRFGAASYQPYLIVVKDLPDGTRKYRLCHNASSKRKGSPSLNDLLLTGAANPVDLLSILLRFRCHTIAISSDIKAAYNQLAVNPPDRDLLRFFAPIDWNKPFTRDNLRVLRFARLNFGVTSSSFTLSAVLRIHLEQDATPVDRELLRSGYVDNFLCGARTVEEGFAKMRYAKKRLADASMILRDEVSSSPELNKLWNVEGKPLSFLGLYWDPSRDVISYCPARITTEGATKRSLLRELASIFDPVGLISPFCLPFRLFIQTLWRNGRGWDEPLTEAEAAQLHGLSQDDPTRIDIPRRVISSTSPADLHIFVDASKNAFAACAYFKCPGSDDSPRLICSRSRLAPLQGSTIPRLELLGSLIGCRLAKFILNEASNPLTRRVVVWTDSRIALAWITNGKTSNPPFVQRRLQEIRSHDFEFRYISTHENPADLATRGLTLSRLQESTLWWHGPNFLSKPESSWPPQPEGSAVAPDTAGTEKAASRPPEVIATPAAVEMPSGPDPKRFSKWETLLGTVAAIISFILRLRRAGWKGFALATSSSGDDIRRVARTVLLRQMQDRAPPTTKEINELRLFKDTDGLWRSRGRLNNSVLPEDACDPIFVPRHDGATTLLIQDIHKKLHHASISHTLNQLRTNFWIPGGRAAVKKAISGCSFCSIRNTRPFRLPPVPDLPRARVSRSRPFDHCAVDYAGPFTVSTEAGTRKVYLALFACLAVRAVHLEVADSLSSEDFLHAFRRFVARRGRPSSLTSDNGTNFKGAAPILMQWTEQGPSPARLIVDYCSSVGIKYSWIPSHSPWCGGHYERLIGIVKASIKQAVGRNLISLEEFRTLLAETEAIVNTRPLSYVADDKIVLRPIDFLDPLSSPGLPSSPPDWNQLDSTHLEETWNRAKTRLDKVWEVFYKDYLVSLRQSHLRSLAQPRGARPRTPQVGEIVLVDEPNMRRGHWRLARITSTEIGRDSQIRTAEVVFANGRTSRRSIATLHPLEADLNHDIAADHPEDAHPVEPESAPEAATDGPATSASVDSQPDHPRDHIIGSQDDAASIIPARYNLRRNPKKKTFFYTVLLSLVAVCHSTTCNFSNIVYTDACHPEGFAVFEESASFCWQHVKCNGHLRSAIDAQQSGSICGEMCRCPSWADDCSPTPIEMTSKEARPHLQPLLAEWTLARTETHPSKSSAMVHSVMLADQTRFTVKKLDLIKKQLPNQDIQCFGEGPATGTEAYCRHHPCEKSATRFCTLPPETTFLRTPTAEVPVAAWSSRLTTVFIPHDRPVPPHHACHVNVSCGSPGIIVDPSLSCRAALLEVCILHDSTSRCSHLKFPQKTEMFIPADGYLLSRQQYALAAWKGGEQTWNTTIACSSHSICDISDCIICWNSARYPGCLYRRLVQGMSVLTATLVFTLVKFAVLVAIHRTCRCRRRRRLPLVPDWKRNPFLAILTITILPTSVQSALSFTASDRQCTYYASGHTECGFTESTIMTLTSDVPSQILLKDKADRPMGSVSIRARTLLQCVPTKAFNTRIADFHTTSIRRCPHAGSCVNDVCSTLSPTTHLEEFTAYQQFPGINMCEESCSCVTCGCLFCSSGCLFTRVYAVTESPLLHVFKCSWKPTTEVHVEFTSNLGTSTLLAALIPPGGTSSSEKLTINVQAVTPPLPLTEAWFLRSPDATLLLDSRALRIAETLRCDNTSCALDNRNVACHAADGGSVCSIDSNRILLDRTTSLPLIYNDVKLFSRDGRVFSDSAYSLTTLQVTLDEAFKASSRHDVAPCDLEIKKIEGCFQCAEGATVDYVCSTASEQRAHVQCSSSTFEVICRSHPVMETTRVQFDRPNIDEQCNVSCPGAKTEAHVRANLFAVDYDVSGSGWKSRPALIGAPSLATVVRRYLKTIIDDVSSRLTTALIVFVTVIAAYKVALRLIGRARRAR